MEYLDLQYSSITNYQCSDTTKNNSNHDSYYIFKISTIFYDSHLID